MRYLLTFIAAAMTFTAVAQTNGSYKYQKGYFKKNGTYVEGHYKTRLNRTNHDNYSTHDNVNTFTSSKGYRAKDYSTQSYNYGSGKPIRKGPKGGQFYINSSGKKVYVPKRKL